MTERMMKVRALQAEAARCERLELGTHDPGIARELRMLADEYRRKASATLARGEPRLGTAPR
jgi:hypothetical protein